MKYQRCFAGNLVAGDRIYDESPDGEFVLRGRVVAVRLGDKVLISVRAPRARTAFPIVAAWGALFIRAARRRPRSEAIPERRFHLRRISDGATFFVRQMSALTDKGERQYRIEYGPGLWGEPFTEAQIEKILSEGQYQRVEEK